MNRELKDWCVIIIYSSAMAANAHAAGWDFKYALGVMFGMIAFKVYDRYFR